MSRTRRKYVDHFAMVNGNIRHWREDWSDEVPLWSSVSWFSKIVKDNRDKKPWGKPPKSFKKMNRRQERAQVRSYMAKEDCDNYENIPRFKNKDRWEWT